MAVHEIARRLIGGVWRTVDAEEDGGGNGGSLPIVSGEGSPLTVLTPDPNKPVYIDTTNGAAFVAVGPTNTDWQIVGGATDSQFGQGPGVYSCLGFMVVADTTVLISDKLAMLLNGTENGWYWNSGNDVDGAQRAGLQVGPSGAFFHSWTPDGVYHVANGVIFPTADPHVAGAWWDNAGTLTKSAG